MPGRAFFLTEPATLSTAGTFPTRSRARQHPPGGSRGKRWTAGYSRCGERISGDVADIVEAAETGQTGPGESGGRRSAISGRDLPVGDRAAGVPGDDVDG